MPKPVLFVLLLTSALSAAAQQAAPQPVAPSAAVPAPLAGYDWARVQALPLSTSIQVHAMTRSSNCTVQAIDATTLSCTQAKLVFQRDEITTIKRPRRGRSTLIAMGIGAGIGAIVGAASSGCSTEEKNSFLGCFLTPTRPQGAAIGGVLFGVVAAPIGYFTDFARTTVYKTH